MEGCMASTQITGGDSAAGADPGGTHSTKPGTPDAGTRKVEETVVSGDRNTRADSKVAGNNPPK